MEIARGFLKYLPRQICEAVAIEGGASGADMMLNSKAEWNGSRIPRLTVEVGATVNQQDFRGGAQVVRKLTNLWADNTLPPPARGREAPGPGPKPKRKRDCDGGEGGRGAEVTYPGENQSKGASHPSRPKPDDDEVPLSDEELVLIDASGYKSKQQNFF